MPFLKSILAAALFLVTAGGVAAGEHQVHYMGFNAFAADKHKSASDFDAYIKKIQPLMAKYDMTVAVYDVMHGGSDGLPADVVTFGTAKDAESLSAFFHDADFQAAFPQLAGALSDHQIIFTHGPFAPTGKEQNFVLLSAVWLNGDDAEEAGREVRKIKHHMMPTYNKLGAEMVAHSNGVQSNQGLGAHVTQTQPPQMLEIWSIEDAHKVLENEKVQGANHHMAPYVSRTEGFWLRKRGNGHH